MKHFKLGFRNRTVLEQISICRRVANAIDKLPAEKRAVTERIPLGTLITSAEQSHARVESLKAELRTALAERKIKLAAARAGVTRAGSALAGDAAGDPTQLLAAGLELEAEKRPIGKPSAPEHLRGMAADHDGVVRLRWKRPVRRCSFLIQMTTDPAAAESWKQVEICIAQSCEISGLESGAKLWFRVAAVNAHGQGPWSNPVCVRVK